MASNIQPGPISLKARIEHIASIAIPSLFIIVNILTFQTSKSFYCDYIILVYTTMLLLLVIAKLIKLNLLNTLLKDNFALIDGIKGKGVILLSISLLYISNGGWRTFMSILLLINGMYLLLIEWLWPSKDNLLCTPSRTNKEERNEAKEGNVDVGNNANGNTVELDKTEESKGKDNPYDAGEDF